MFVHPCFSISRTLQFCCWRRGGTCYISAPCKTHSFWFPVFAHMRSKWCNVASLLGASSLEDESVFGLGSLHVQKGICPSLCLHIHKPKNLPRTPVTSIQTLSPSKLLAANKEATRRFFGLWMCKRKLEQIPFCRCQNPNPISLSSSKLLATNKEVTLQDWPRTWAKNGPLGALM